MIDADCHEHLLDGENQQLCDNKRCLMEFKLVLSKTRQDSPYSRKCLSRHDAYEWKNKKFAVILI